MSGSSEERSLPASDKKLREAREKGQVGGSRDFVTAVSSVAALSYVALHGQSLLTASQALMDDAARSTIRPWQEAMPALLARAGWTALDFLLPLLGIVVASVVAASVIGNRGFVFSIKSLAPKLERIDPLSGIARIFSMRGGIDAVKTLLKFVVVSATFVTLLRSAVIPLIELPSCGVRCVPELTRSLLGPLALAAMLLFLVLGGLDLRLQRFVFQREMRMTRSEQKRERKNAEGNPLIRSAHRQEQRAAMRNHVRTGIRNATFLIHGNERAVAFRYAPPDVLVPVLVARGIGDAAAMLLEEAPAHNVSCVHDADVALLVTVRMRIGTQLPKDLFGAVIGCMREAKVI